MTIGDRHMLPDPTSLSSLNALASAATVLVVDDQTDVREAITGLVEALGYQVVSFASGRAALDHVEAGHAADAALIDLLMPGMRGGTAIEALRALKPDLAILLVSGHPDLDRAAASLGPLSVLHKPFRLAELSRALRRAMAIAHAAARH